MQRILLATGSRVIPRQFSEQLKSPFLGSLTSNSLFHVVGIFSSSKILFSSLKRNSLISLPPCFNASGGISSIPAALSFFSYFKAFFISGFLMLTTLMFKSGPCSNVTG